MLSGTVRSLIVRAVLLGKMIIGAITSQSAAMVRITVTCSFSQTDVLTVTVLQPFFAKDLLSTTSKKSGVLPTSTT